MVAKTADHEEVWQKKSDFNDLLSHYALQIKLFYTQMQSFPVLKWDQVFSV